MFNAVPTPNQAPEAVTEEGGHDNEVENQVEGENVSSGKSIPAENEHGFVLSSVKMQLGNLRSTFFVDLVLTDDDTYVDANLLFTMYHLKTYT